MKTAKEAKERLVQFYGKLVLGSGEDILKPKKTGRPITDFLNRLDYIGFSFFDWLDTKFLFKRRAVRTSKGRVRSRAERKLAHFFRKHHIRYVYEPTLTLGDINLHPDFYFPEHDVYVELWGLADSDEHYRKIMGLKQELYRKYNISVISVYLRHLKDLEKSFPVLFQKMTGKKFPLFFRKEVN